MGRLNPLTAYGAPISEYKKAKLKILKRDFQIDVTIDEQEHLNELESEIAIDRYCRMIISSHWR